MMGKVVVQVWESNLVLGPNRLSDDDLVDVIKLIPVFIPVVTQSSCVKLLAYQVNCSPTCQWVQNQDDKFIK